MARQWRHGMGAVDRGNQRCTRVHTSVATVGAGLPAGGSPASSCVRGCVSTFWTFSSWPALALGFLFDFIALFSADAKVGVIFTRVDGIRFPFLLRMFKTVMTVRIRNSVAVTESTTEDEIQMMS